jgi:branched-chain amino acid transport system ATP-binding protein
MAVASEATGPPAELEVRGISKRFGGVTALDRVSFRVAPGRLVGVLGPNGAGKSTLFHIICGYIPQDEGTVLYRGRVLDGLPLHRRVQMGIGIVFQRSRIFRGMTVLENVAAGFHTVTKAGVVDVLLRLPRHQRELRWAQAEAWRLLEQFGLTAVAHAPAEEVPFGVQRMVVLARALAGQPRLLLLDEPASGLNPEERQALAGLLKGIRQRGLTVLLIEHDVEFVVGLADSAIVLDYGRMLAQGDPQKVLRERSVQEAFLGPLAVR